MTGHLRRFSRIVCACTALTASSFAYSQSLPPAASQEQAAQASPQTSADGNAHFLDQDSRRTEYRGFLQLVTTGEQWLKAAPEGEEEGSSPQVKHWMKILGIREDEVRALLIIAGDSWERISRIDDQARKEGDEYRQNPTKERREAFYTHGKEFGIEETEILDETIVRLRQELGQEDFKKLDDYIYRRSSGALLEAAAKRRASDAKSQQFGQSEPIPTKEPQQ